MVPGDLDGSDDLRGLVLGLKPLPEQQVSGPAGLAGATARRS